MKRSDTFLALVFLLGVGLVVSLDRSLDLVHNGGRAPIPRLFWFIPDGMRCDPELFNVFRWAEEGRLPNIRRMMAQGAYGFCRPTFPTHTPTNFATLFTGAYPEVHGVNDGPMHTEGNPLSRVSVGGFSSAAKLVPPLWVTLERDVGAEVALLSVPGSTPPELERGITIRGRWGGWGADFHAVNFQDRGDLSQRREQGRASRLFFFGPQLTQYVEKRPAVGWSGVPESHSPPLEATFEAWGGRVLAHLTDSTDDGRVSYDRLTLALDRAEPLVTLAAGAWSDWLPIRLAWKIPGRDLEQRLETSFRAKVIKLDDNGFFRVRLLFNNLNRHVAAPSWIAEEVIRGVGPMVDFVDNFPPQLVFFPEDRTTFLEEAAMSLDWHREAVGFLIDKYTPDVVIHDVYTPNQMLTSRWWMGAVDPASARYGEYGEEERAARWSEVHWLYEQLDAIVGQLLARVGEDGYVVVTSDHGAVPLDRWVRLNNLFAREGLLEFTVDETTGEPIIDWQKTTAVYLKMCHVYIDPDGLDGPWQRASGPAYEALRARVKTLLETLEDDDGTQPIVRIVEHERVRQLRLHPDRCGDLVIANRPGYGWSEEMTGDRAVFARPLKSGYKQAILSGDEPGMWTPFLIVGPGVKKGHFLGATPIEAVDQYPTIMHLLGREIPAHVQGRVLREILERADG